MAESTVVTLTLPRKMLVTMRRARGHEAVVVLDEVPVAVRTAAEADAPPTLRLPDSRGSADVRLHDGLFYLPLDIGPARDGASPEEYVRWTVARIRDAFGIVDHNIHYQAKHDPAEWKDLVVGANRKRGLGAEVDLPIAEVHDDGRAGLAALAAHEADRLLLVDGRMHRRIHAPHYMMRGHDAEGASVINALPSYGISPAKMPGVAFDRFRADRYDEAVAFLRLWREAGGRVDPREYDRFEILRPDLLAAAMPPDDLGASASAYAGAVLGAAAACVGHCPDAAIARFVEIRARTDAPEGREAAIASMESLRAFVDEVVAAKAGAGWRATKAFEFLEATAKAAFLRFDGIDVPREQLTRDAETIASLRF